MSSWVVGNNLSENLRFSTQTNQIQNS